MKTLFLFLSSIALTIFFSSPSQAQNDTLYNFSETAKEYKVAAVKVEGTRFLDPDILIIISGVRPGKTIKIPGEELPNAIKKLWKQGLFGDVKIRIDSIVGDQIYLTYVLQEKPKISKFAFNSSLKKGDVDDINDDIKKYKGAVLTENVKQSCTNLIRSHYLKKGYFNIDVAYEEVPDTTATNAVFLKIKVNPGNKYRIGEVVFEGNTAISSAKALRTFKKVKPYIWWNVFRGSKFSQGEFVEDQEKLIGKYKNLGYLNAAIAQDTFYPISDNRLRVLVKIDEGRQFFFRNVTVAGNTIYPDSLLESILGVKKGDVFNQSLLDQRLYMDQSGRDITSLYMDNGYLFFQLNPTQIPVGEDSIDLMVNISEGTQATINKITIKGNEKTNDHVIMRELRTKPGQKFSRNDIIRTTRELGQLGFFDPEQINIVPYPNPATGTVDLEYTVVEKSSDQVELSGGFGGRFFVGSLGLTLNNFSAKNALNPKKWAPVPTGDGQKLGIRAVANALYFRSYNLSFTEPWLGGKKPNSFGVSLYSSQQLNGIAKYTDDSLGNRVLNPNHGSLTIYGASISLGKRLKKPDDFFNILHSINYQRYEINKYGSINAFLSNGSANSIFIRETLSRNSVGDNPIFPTYGSNITLSLAMTPPRSLFTDVPFEKASAEDRYKWIEYHKWRFDGAWYTSLTGKFVLATQVQLGFLGGYSKNIEQPFGRFFVGGSGLTGFNLDDRELIRLRGYADNSIGPRVNINPIGGKMFQKFTAELRYPVSLNPQASVYILGFLEAGNNFANIRSFQPFNNMKSAGAGIRVFLPMFGLLGVDWGYGFDNNPNFNITKRGNLHISIGQTF